LAGRTGGTRRWLGNTPGSERRPGMSSCLEAFKRGRQRTGRGACGVACLPVGWYQPRHERQQPWRTRPAAVRRVHAMWTVERPAPLGGTRCGPRPSGEHRVLCCSQARQADTSGAKCGPVWACRSWNASRARAGAPLVRQPQPKDNPATINGQTWTVPRAGERDASDPGRGTSAKRCPMRPVLRTGPVWLTAGCVFEVTRRVRRRWWRSAPGPAKAYLSYLAHC
jgi:hypothetical protein